MYVYAEVKGDDDGVCDVDDGVVVVTATTDGEAVVGKADVTEDDMVFPAAEPGSLRKHNPISHKLTIPTLHRRRGDSRSSLRPTKSP